MYKFQDCFLTSGVFNEALIKRFRESYDPEHGSRLWMIPGHVIYTTPDRKVFTCDARPLDLLSPSEPSTGELIFAVAPVLEIFFETENQAPRMYIALSNGDVQIFEYRALLYEWARVGYFNVNIVSPNAINNPSSTIKKVLISPKQNAIYWAEEVEGGKMNLNLYKRSLPVYSVREITQSTLGTPQILLKNCPNLDVMDIQGNVCIVPHLPHSVNLYLVLSARCHLWLFDISGKCLWRGIITDQPFDFITLCMKSVGLWTQNGEIKMCHLLYSDKKVFYILHDNTLLCITANGEINRRTKLPFTVNKSHKYYILWNILCIFTKDSLKICSIINGHLFQTLEFEDHMLVRGIWSVTAIVPCLGLYTDTTILMLQPMSLQSIFNSKVSCYSKVLHLLAQGNIHLFALMKDIVYHKNNNVDMEPLQKIPNALQSKGLLLALIQLCRERGIDVTNFPFSSTDMQLILNPNEQIVSIDTRLKELLEPLVECYCKLEQTKMKL